MRSRHEANIFEGNCWVLNETICWILIQIGKIAIHMYRPDEVKGGRRGLAPAPLVSKPETEKSTVDERPEKDDDSSSKEGSDDEGIDGSDVESGGVPAAADTAAVAASTLPTPVQQFLVDEFANTDGEIRNTAILHFHDWGPQLIPRHEYQDEDGEVIPSPEPCPPPFDLCVIPEILEAIEEVKFGIRRYECSLINPYAILTSLLSIFQFTELSTLFR